MFVLLTLFLVAASANVQQFMNQEEAMAMMAQPYDDFVSKVMAQIRTAMAQAHEAYAPTSDTEGEVTELHLAVAKPFSPTEKSSETENSAVESVKVVIESLQRAVARGSAFYNAGRADLCARLYFQTVAQTAQVMAELGENDATVFFAQLLFQASSAASADDAAWILRAGIERAVAWVRDSPKYAAVFEPSSSSSVDQDNQNTCAYGLLIQRVGDVVTVYETRCKTECDEDLDEIDAVFFVEESSSSSSSDVVSETEPVYGDDDVSQLATATDESDQEERQMARHRLWRSMGMCAVLGMACAVLVLMVAWRRRLQKIRRMREQAYAAQQQKRVFGAPSDPFTKTPSPLNAPYLV